MAPLPLAPPLMLLGRFTSAGLFDVPGLAEFLFFIFLPFFLYVCVYACVYVYLFVYVCVYACVYVICLCMFACFFACVCLFHLL